ELQLGDRKRVHERPGLRPVAEDRELDGQALTMLLEELVDALHVRLDESARLVGDHGQVELRSASETERPHEAIRFEPGLAKHFRETPLRRAAVDVHLPESVLRGDVPLSEEDVM